MPLCLFPFELPVRVAPSARPPALFGGVGVLLGKLMPIFAVGLGLLFGNPRGHGLDGQSAVSMSPGGQDVCEAHAALRSRLYGVAFQVRRAVRKVKHVVTHPFYGNGHNVSAISLLIFARRPATIAGRVVAVVVDAVKRVPGWARAHVGGESLIRVSPLRAHFDASAAVVGECFYGGCVASTKHVLPRGVQGWGSLKWHEILQKVKCQVIV